VLFAALVVERRALLHEHTSAAASSAIRFYWAAISSARLALAAVAVRHCTPTLRGIGPSRERPRRKIFKPRRKQGFECCINRAAQTSTCARESKARSVRTRGFLSLRQRGLPSRLRRRQKTVLLAPLKRVNLVDEEQRPLSGAPR